MGKGCLFSLCIGLSPSERFSYLHLYLSKSNDVWTHLILLMPSFRCASYLGMDPPLSIPISPNGLTGLPPWSPLGAKVSFSYLHLYLSKSNDHCTHLILSMPSFRCATYVGMDPPLSIPKGPLSPGLTPKPHLPHPEHGPSESLDHPLLSPSLSIILTPI